MKSLVTICAIIMFCGEAFSLGDTSILPNGETVSQTVSHVNQLTKEEKEKQEVAPLTPQDEQEQRYLEDMKREKAEYEKQKRLDDRRSKEPDK